MAPTKQQLAEVWGKITDAVKKGPVNIPLWEAMECSVPLAFENGRLTVGLAITDLHRSPVYRTPQVRATIESHASKILGQPVTLVVAEGTDEAALRAEEAKQAARDAVAERARGRAEQRIASAREKSWDDLNIELQRLYTAVHDKSLPWNLVTYLQDGFRLLAELDDASRERGDPQEQRERGLARAMHRLASLVECPIVWVASEYGKYRTANQPCDERA